MTLRNRLKEVPLVPVRTCVGCRSRRPQHELLRVARSPEGIQLDAGRRRHPGRGAYLCPDTTCITRVSSRDGSALRKALRAPTSADLHAVLDAVRATVAHHGVLARTVRSNA